MYILFLPVSSPVRGHWHYCRDFACMKNVTAAHDVSLVLRTGRSPKYLTEGVIVHLRTWGCWLLQGNAKLPSCTSLLFHQQIQMILCTQILSRVWYYQVSLFWLRCSLPSLFLLHSTCHICSYFICSLVFQHLIYTGVSASRGGRCLSLFTALSLGDCLAYSRWSVSTY